MNQWMKAAIAGCCLIMLTAAAGCSSDQDINGPKTPAQTASFNGGPMPANSPWAKMLPAAKNAGNAVPKPHPAATSSADAAPHSL